MTYHFSATTLCFYPAPMLGDYKDLPDDLIEVGEDVFIKYHPNNQPKGKSRGATKKGMPCWVDEVIPALEGVSLISWNKSQKSSLMKVAESKIAILERAVKLGISTDKENESLKSLEEYTVLLNRLDTSEPKELDWPALPEEMSDKN